MEKSKCNDINTIYSESKHPIGLPKKVNNTEKKTKLMGSSNCFDIYKICALYEIRNAVSKHTITPIILYYEST
jgi:hypothetical protein